MIESVLSAHVDQPEKKEIIMKKISNNDEMLPEYDFSKGVRGKYTKRYMQGTNIVMLDPDVYEYFSDQKSVNEALRSLVGIMKRTKMVEHPQ
jgi:hypothetical protein